MSELVGLFEEFPVGTAVTISGSNFGATQGTSTVTFSGTVAFTGATTKTSVVQQHAAVAKVGATAGWVVAGNPARCLRERTPEDG